MSGPHLFPLHIAPSASAPDRGGVYICVACRRAFARPIELQIHLDDHPRCRRQAMRAAHGVGAGRRCRSCGATFRTGAEMYLHSVDGVLSFVCSACYRPAERRAEATPEEVPY